MRITQSMLSQNTLRHINQGYERLGRLQDQLASQKKITRASQDPVVAMKGMRYRTEVVEVEQFKRNLSEVYSWMDNADSGLDKVTQALHRVRELVVQASNDTYDASQRANIAKEVQQINEHIASLANTSVNGKYIFNGTNTTNKPVDLNNINIPFGNFNTAAQQDFVINHNNKQFTFNGTAFVNGDETITVGEGPEFALNYQQGDNAPETLQHNEVILSRKAALSTNNENVAIEVMKGIHMPVNIRPQNVFSAEMFADLNKLVTDLNNPNISSEELSGFLNKLDKSIDNVVSERAELGARVNRVEMIDQRVMEQEIVARRVMSDNEDIDIERVIMELITQESVHRAALSAGARIMQPTLLDFLR
ncbi:flagellar hook-associated protein FlgL [Alkalihalobacterium bogoriense]|uniref:flagellar hook-associated protein FlgL n=1 Tax=Alkalihalobacterium bogoriense TaxID=246272 RepID=UPI00047B9316|nr:flagellar hook-associated protein FlgL [Alkalihalobacterium bogoriense]